MKIDRLIGILAILLQQKVTAPYLADKFEVSRRTINRDIENLCKAGIPVVTEQGHGGGISIMEGYRMDRTLLTSSDMQAILAGLKSLDSISGTNRYRQLMDKLSAGNSSILASNSHILINLSSWYKETLTPKIELIQAAIERKEKIGFTYYAPGGRSERDVEPVYLIFHWSSWYVYGFCTQKQDVRLFKLNRMTGLHNTGAKFVPRQLPPPDLAEQRAYPVTVQAKALFEPEAKWRLIEEFGMDSFVERKDGRLLFQQGFSGEEHLFTWILSFGTQAELLEPCALRARLSEIAAGISTKNRVDTRPQKYGKPLLR